MCAARCPPSFGGRLVDALDRPSIEASPCPRLYRIEHPIPEIIARRTNRGSCYGCAWYQAVQKSTDRPHAIGDDIYVLLILIAALIGMVGWAVAWEAHQRDIDNLGSMSMQWLTEYRA